MLQYELKPDELKAIQLIDGTRIAIDYYTKFRRIKGQLDIVYAESDYLVIQQNKATHIYTWVIPVKNIAFYEYQHETGIF